MTHLELQLGPTGPFPNKFKVELKNGGVLEGWDYTSAYIGPNERVLLDISMITDGTPIDEITIVFEDSVLFPSRKQGDFTVTSLVFVQASSLGEVGVPVEGFRRFTLKKLPLAPRAEEALPEQTQERSQ